MDQFVITPGLYNSWEAQLSPTIKAGVRILAETDARRIDHGIHAYVLLDFPTDLGPMRVRDLKILLSRDGERYYVRWPWFQTKFTRPGASRPDRLDVVGPRDYTSRELINGKILALFHQIREEAAKGTLGRQPAVAEKLQHLKQELEAQDAPAVEA